MNKYPINKEKYNQKWNKHFKRLITYFSILTLIVISFLSICLYIIEMDLMISVISMTLTFVVAIIVIYFTLKNIMKINNEIILSTIYRINDESITILNANENIIIEKNNINIIEHYKNNTIGILFNKFNRKIIYSNCIDNYNEFYEKLCRLHEIQEYKNKVLNIFWGILGGILVLSTFVIKNIFPHSIYGLLSGVLIYGLLLIFFIFKLCNKAPEKNLKKGIILLIIANIILLLRTILEYIS